MQLQNFIIVIYTTVYPLNSMHDTKNFGLCDYVKFCRFGYIYIKKSAWEAKAKGVFCRPNKPYCSILSSSKTAKHFVIMYLHQNSQTVKKGAAHAKKAA